MGWFNPTDVGNSSKEGRGYTKTGLNSGTCLEVARPKKSIPTLCPWKRDNSLGSVNSKIGIWAPTSSLFIQEAWPNLPRLFSLPSKSCIYWNPDRRSFKTLLWGQTNYFYQPWSKTTPKWERPFMDVWSKNPQISSRADGKSRPHYIPLWGSWPSHPSAYPQGLSPLSLLPRNLGPLDKTPRGIVGRSSDQSWGNPVHSWQQLCLGWKKRSQICNSLQFWDHRV